MLSLVTKMANIGRYIILVFKPATQPGHSCINSAINTGDNFVPHEGRNREFF